MRHGMNLQLSWLTQLPARSGVTTTTSGQCSNDLAPGWGTCHVHKVRAFSVPISTLGQSSYLGKMQTPGS